MMPLLQTGQPIYLRFSHLSCSILEFVDKGGQGEIYKAVLQSGTIIAVKWYPRSYLKLDPLLEQRLTGLVKLDFPFEEFIWPFDLTDSPNTPAFGYAMPWCPENFKSIEKILSEVQQPTFRMLTSAGFNLITAFSYLHSGSDSGGRCYRDISASNVRMDPATGEIRILDNDNVDITGTPGPMRGTQKYQAPEVVLGKSFANVYTDLHSLAVILFRLLLVDHPLEGEKENQIMGDAIKLYGSEPVFIFDSVDESNRPIPGVHQTAPAFWKILPKYLRSLFEQAFTIGLINPQKRVVESQWREALVRLRDSTFECSCGAENFYDLETIRASGGLGTCWNCGETLNPPARMLLDDNFESIIMLTKQTQLFPHHILRMRYNFSEPLARVVGNTEGLENLSQQKWFLRNTNGSSGEVYPGQVAPLDPQVRIHFGRVTATIRK